MFITRRYRRRGGLRRFRRPQQLNWGTGFTTSPQVIAPGAIAYAPLTLQVESEVSSDQVIQRIRGNILSSVPVATTSIGQITFGICVEDAKDLTLGNVAALPNPRGASIEDIEPDKWMWLASPWEQMFNAGATNLVGVLQLDVRAKRKLDISYQQVVLAMANGSSGNLTVSLYSRVLLKEVP